MLSWNQHIDQVTRELSSATYVLRHTKNSLPIDTLKIIYFACVHTTISCGIIFWENSSAAKNVFLLQKEILRIIVNKQPKRLLQGTFQGFVNYDLIFRVYILPDFSCA